MIVKTTIILNVGEQDSTQDAIESAENQMRSMELEELIDIMDSEIID